MGCAGAGVMVARVYVSSTVADLRAERAAVFDWLRLARHQAIESYLPDSDTVRDSCLDDVAACDLYVLIAGHRYGFQPPSDNPDGLSITQLEFRRAGEAGIPRVALLRTSVPDVRLSDLLDPARAPLVAGFREEVAREVRAAEFSDPQGLVQGLSTGVSAELAKLDKREEDRAGREAGLVLRVAPRPVFLAGREGLLAELDARLAGDGGGPRVAVLYGLGGAGKTSVAVEYAHRHLAEVGVCWQFAAEDPAVLAAEFGVLAAQLGEAAAARDPVASVHGALARARGGWLVVFDNAPDRASVAPFVPPAGPGRVLITTQNQIWPPGQAVDVPVLDVEVAADFLVSRTGDADRMAAAGAGRGSWAGCRSRWSRLPRTCRLPGRRWPGICCCSGTGRRICWPAGRWPGTWTWRRRWGWRCRGWQTRLRRRRGWCGCWRSWRPSRCR